MALEYRKGSTAFAQDQSDAPRMMNDAGGNADDLDRKSTRLNSGH